LLKAFKNPLFVMALPPETRVPEKDSPGTLVVNPGDNPTQDQMDQYKVVWFTPGVHDLSQMGSYPWHQTMINGGQRFYLEGGSYVMARFKKDTQTAGSASITGRGMISGINHEWIIGYIQDGSEEMTLVPSCGMYTPVTMTGAR
jgi:hypothetical protein